MSDLFNENIRKKLSEASYPYENEAWEKMELLLDEKENRKILFWWIAGALLLSSFVVSGAVWLNNSTSKQITNHSPNNIQLHLPNNEINDSSNEIQHNKKSIEKEPANRKENSELNTTATINKSKSNSRSHVTNSIAPNSTIQTDEYYYLTAHGAQLFNHFIPESEIENINQEGYYEKRKRKNDVKYQIGLQSFVGTSRVFKQKHNDYNHSFAPSFSVGISNELVLNEKWVIAASILYAKTVFRINNPETYSIPLEFYDNSSHLIQIPIGVRFYPVSGKKINFYLTAGIINNLQIKETMQFYSNEPNQPIPAIEIPINSSSGTEELADFNAGNNTRLFNSTDEVANLYSVNQSSRYYMQIYTGVGVDIVAGKRMHFFAQPGFNYDLHKVGTQNKRVYQFGANTGLRWKF
jgi:hypothetical protein